MHWDGLVSGRPRAVINSKIMVRLLYKDIAAVKQMSVHIRSTTEFLNRNIKKPKHMSNVRSILIDPYLFWTSA